MRKWRERDVAVNKVLAICVWPTRTKLETHTGQPFTFPAISLFSSQFIPIDQRFLTGGRQAISRGVRALTCSTTWKVFELERVPSKGYDSAILRHYMSFSLVPAEVEAGVKFLEIFQTEFEPAYKHSWAQLSQHAKPLPSMPSLPSMPACQHASIPSPACQGKSLKNNIRAVLAFENNMVHI